MSLPANYVDYWKSWVPRHPPMDPRGPQHGDPDPEFATLCAVAERVGACVELDVSAKAYSVKGNDDESYRYRNIVALHVRPDDTERIEPRVTVRLEIGDTLRSMAERARRELEARF